MTELTDPEREQIVEILSRRANEVASYSGEVREKVPGSVELALTREIRRLRDLADKIAPETKKDE